VAMTMFGSGAGPNAITSFVGNEIINDSQEDDNISRGRGDKCVEGEEVRACEQWSCDLEVCRAANARIALEKNPPLFKRGVRRDYNLTNVFSQQAPQKPHP
jgi:hypothetical protein